MAGEQRLLSYGDVVLYEGDLNLLKAGGWLNDRLITFAVQYIFDQLPEERKEAIAVMNAPECEVVKFLGGEVEAAFGSLEMHKKEMVLFVLSDSGDPTRANSGNHWAVMAYVTADKKFYYMDSIPGRNKVVAREVARAISSLLPGCSSQILVTVPCATQTNGSDCGLYAIEYIRTCLVDGVHAISESNPSTVAVQSTRKLWLDVIDKLKSNGKTPE